MDQPLHYRLLRPFVQVRENEAVTAILMFSYSFLSMTAYNILKPVTRSKFISDIGAANLPYVQLAAGVIIGLIMTGYSWMVSRLPRRWSLAITQGGIAGLLRPAASGCPPHSIFSA
jgi:ATP/ADP translocase